MEEKDLVRAQKFQRKKALFYFFLGFLILYLLLTRVDIGKSLEIAKQTILVYYLIALFFFYLSIFLRAVRWRILLENAGFSAGLLETVEIFYLSWFANCLVPAKLGDIYRGYLLKRARGIPASGVLGTVFMERTIDVFFMVLFFLASGLTIFGKNFPENIRLALWVGFAICIMLFVALWILKTQEKRFHYIPDRIWSIFLSFKEGTTTSLNRGTLPSVIFLTIVVWFLEGARLLFVIKAISIELSFPIVIFVAIGSAFLTSIPLTPAGLGAVEAAIATLLILFGIEKEAAVSVALLDRLISYWSLIVFGGISYLFSKRT